MPKKTVRKKLSNAAHVKERKKVFKLFYTGVISFATLFLIIAFSVLYKAPFCANSVSCIKDLSGQYNSNAKTGTFDGQTFAVPPEIASDFTQTKVLGDSTSTDPKRIEVDLTHQMLYAFEGSRLIYSFLVSTGKYNYTPTGVYHIWIKLRYANMVGGHGADYYNLPNVPYVMYWAGGNIPKTDGYGIHGTYWHHNFGHPMSHGCINMYTPDAEALYNWADPPTNGYTTKATDDNPGTEIIIYGTTPTS